MRSLYVHAIPLAMLLVALLGGGPGCGPASRSKQPTIPQIPLVGGIQQNPLDGYAVVSAPVTSSVTHATPLWLRAELVGHVPHPSARLTRSVLRPGDWNTPLQRVQEEVVLTRPDPHPAVPAHAVGLPPGWQVAAITPLITLSMKWITTTDQHGNTVQAFVIDQQASGLTDHDQRVIWCTAGDDATTAEGSPLMPALRHELAHAWIYHEAIRRGATHEQATRESKAIDPATTTP